MKRSLCILLVEDDVAIGPTTFHALARLGHAVVLAITAPAAYQHLSEPHEFDLVLLDLQLGDQLSEPLILRLKEAGIEIPKIVIFSAQPVEELHRVARTLGASGLVQKPASIAEVQKAIERAAA